MALSDDRPGRFAQALAKLQDDEDRAVLARLRRGAGRPPGTVPDTFPFVVPRTAGLSRREQDRYYLVASLFTLHAIGTRELEALDAKGNYNLGATMRRVRASADTDSIDRRFRALLGCHEDDLPNHLRHAVSLAASKGAAVNWAQLLRDLLQPWNHPTRYVQRRWAEQYWAPGADEQAPDHGNSTANTEGESES
jgi:CRISPR system Cascade subunit CasB